MNTLLSITGVVLVIFALSSCALEQEMVTPAKPAAPAVAEAKKAPPIVEAKKVPPPETVVGTDSITISPPGDCFM